MFAKIAGRTIAEMADIDLISITHPDDIQSDLDNMALLVKGEINGFQMEKRYIRPDGSIVWINMTTSHLINEENMPLRHLCMIEDITERKRIEESLIKSENSARALLDAMPDLMFKINSEGVFLDYKSEKENFVYQTESIIGLKIRDIMPPDFADLVEQKMRQVFQTGEMQLYEYNLLLPTKGIREFEARMVNCSFDEVVIVVRDITERKKTELEIVHKNEELRKINAEKDKFFSILAHDLRSPFNGFLGLTEIIAKELHQMTLDEIQQIALLMNNSATNLYTLLGNLLEWSRLQRGLIAVNPEPFVLLPRISNSLKLIVESAKNKVIQLDFNIPNDLMVFTDANMLEGIIRNLANNSVKFTPKGGRIVVSAKTEANSKIRISVKDTGIGMSKEMINNLFRLDVNTRRRGTEGEPNSGLGLIICQDLIEKLGGELLIESEQGKGTEFYFTIPG
jgi:PAS domain S-box-containing protein